MLGSLGRLWQTIRPIRGRLYLGLLSALLASLMALGIPQVLQLVVDRLHVGGTAAVVWTGCAIVLGLGVMEAALIYLRRVFAVSPSTLVEKNIRTAFYAKVLDMPVSFHDAWGSGQLLSRMMGDISTMRRWIAFGIIMAVTDAVTIVVGMALLIRSSALLALGADRRFDAQVFNPENGGPILWQHLFWFFGHPEVYVLALPFFGIASEIIPAFSRKPMFGYKTLVGATIAIAALSVTVWAHHMYTTGAIMLDFFAFMTMLIAVPTGVKFFNWLGTMWRGSITFETPMLFTLGFLSTFTFGGLTGVILSSPVLDFHLSDSYFVVAHFHYVIFGTVAFEMFAGFYFWWPKMFGYKLHEGLGKFHFWFLMIGFHTTFLIQHWLGVEGAPRRYVNYLAEDDFGWMNQISTVGAFILGASTLPFILNVVLTHTRGKKVEVDDPWGYGASLEWATSCPPPRHNFHSLPRIRSERPAFDLHHPEIAALDHMLEEEPEKTPRSN